MSTVRKAVIPAAGWGTRFLPFTKSVPKEMLPIVDRPAIQYVVEEAIRCGIDDILIITSPYKKAIEDHFDRSAELEHLLAEKDKHHDLRQVRELADLADIHFIRQGEALGLGHAIGIARRHVGREPFAVLLGDDVMHPTSGVLRGMIDTYAERGSASVALMQVPAEEIGSYGCARVEPSDDLADPLVRVSGLVEKPRPDEAPSNLAVIGRYVFGPEIFDHIAGTGRGHGGEIQLTDAMRSMMAEREVLGWVFEGGRYDTGNKVDYLRTVLELALERDDLRDELVPMLTRIARAEGLC
jgi:UTP--glucose-1-phosphate uridylyltransferase